MLSKCFKLKTHYIKSNKLNEYVCINIKSSTILNLIK